MKEVYDFFKTIYASADPEWFVEIRALEPQVCSYWDRIKNLDSWITKGLEMAKECTSLHYAVVPTLMRDRKALAQATTLWVDMERPLDEQTLWAMKKTGLIPSANVSSGRGHHLYFALEKPVNTDKARQINEALAYLFDGDVGAGNPSHTLRFPGSWNHKYAPKKFVTVEVSGKLFNPSFFDSFVKQVPTYEKSKKPYGGGISVSLKQLEAFADRCPIVRTALNDPERLSYRAWFSLCAWIKDRDVFMELSRLDRERFNENEASRMWDSIKSKNYRPYACEKTEEGKSCEHRNGCNLYKLFKHVNVRVNVNE